MYPACDPRIRLLAVPQTAVQVRAHRRCHAFRCPSTTSSDAFVGEEHTLRAEHAARVGDPATQLQRLHGLETQLTSAGTCSDGVARCARPAQTRDAVSPARQPGPEPPPMRSSPSFANSAAVHGQPARGVLTVGHTDVVEDDPRPRPPERAGGRRARTGADGTAPHRRRLPAAGQSAAAAPSPPHRPHRLRPNRSRREAPVTRPGPRHELGQGGDQEPRASLGRETLRADGHRGGLLFHV